MKSDEELIERAIEIGVQFSDEMNYDLKNDDAPNVLAEVVSALLATSALTGLTVRVILDGLRYTAPDAGKAMQMTRIVREAVKTHE
jgi:hypothetical protein